MPEPQLNPYVIRWADPAVVNAVIFDAPPERKKKKIVRNDYSVLNMEKKVYEIFAVGVQSDKPEDNFVGVEIENETKQPFELPFIAGWTRHREGSLRDFGFEFVSHRPVKYKDVREHLKSLFDNLALARGNYKLSNSSRTSTHVHLDASHMDYGNVITTAIVYWMLEEYLSNFCGETRKGNLFCIRSCDSLSVQGVIARSLNNLEAFPLDLVGEEVRYGSLNFSSIPKFGSLESRLMRGVDNAEEAMLWTSVLQRIKNFSLKFDNPIHFKKTFEQEYPAADFPTIVLGDLAQVMSAHLPKGFNIQQAVRQGFLSSSAIFGAKPVWDFSAEINEAKERIRLEEEEVKRIEKEFKVAKAKREKILRDAMARAAAYNVPEAPADAQAVEDNLDQINVLELDFYEDEGVDR